MDAKKKIAAAKSQLLLDYPFYGALLLGLEETWDEVIHTTGINQRGLIYAEPFINELTVKQVLGLLLHEAEHYAFMHHARVGKRNRQVYNLSADGVINLDLMKDRSGKFSLPPNGFIDTRLEGMDADQAYAFLMKELEKQRQDEEECKGGKGPEPQKKPGGQKAPPKPGGDKPPEKDEKGTDQKQEKQQPSSAPPKDKPQGEPQEKDEKEEAEGGGQGDTPKDSENSGEGEPEQEGDGGGGGFGEQRPDGFDQHPWESMTKEQQQDIEHQVVDSLVRAAQIAKSAGKLPGRWEEYIDKLLTPQIDWKNRLRHLIHVTAKNRYRWVPPNRRYIYNDMYVPSLQGESLEIAVGMDTSGSISTEEFTVGLSEVIAIADEFESHRIHLIQCDAAIHDYKVIEQGDEVPKYMKGRGGTSFKPIFEKVNERIAEGDAIVALLVFSDGYPNDDWPKPLEIPVIWVLTTDVVPPWGEAVRLKVKE